MTDYIKREDVDTYFNNRNAWYNFYETLESIPSADVVEVKHGYWEDTNLPKGDLGWKCSVCGYGVFRWNNNNYCPRCGARMDREEP